MAKWVPLKDLASNEEGKTDYRMHYNAYRFIECLNVWMEKGKQGKICMDQE